MERPELSNFDKLPALTFSRQHNKGHCSISRGGKNQIKCFLAGESFLEATVMVRQKSGEMMASPTPSIDSLNSAAVGSLCGLEQVSLTDPRDLPKHICLASIRGDSKLERCARNSPKMYPEY